MDKTAAKSHKTLRMFALASFLNDMGSDIIYPIWPLFVTNILKANMAALGFLDGLGDALVSLSQAASGYFSDRLKKRKIFIWLGYLFGSLSRIGYALSSIWQHLIPFRILDRMGKIRSAPRDAFIADISTNETRGKNFGLLRSMDNAGAVVGILICILFLQLLGIRMLFALAAIPSLAGALLIIVHIKERKTDGPKIFKGMEFKEIDPQLRLYMFLNALYALGAFSYSFLLVYAKNSGFKIGFIPVLYLIYTTSASLFSLPFGKLSDRVGRKPVLMLAYFFWAVVCLGFIFCRSRLLLVGLFVLYGIHKAALDPVQRTLLCELSPLPFRASCLGGFQMIVGLCAFPASVAAGFLWEQMGVFAPFVLSLGLTASAFILLVLIREHR